MQVRIEAWKIQNFNGVWTCDLAIPVRHSNQLGYEATDVGSWSFAVQYMKQFIYHFTFIPHGLIRTHKWPDSNISGFIAQLVRASHRYCDENSYIIQSHNINTNNNLKILLEHKRFT